MSLVLVQKTTYPYGVGEGDVAVRPRFARFDGQITGHG
jgi:hypothetical protein